jgi:hypothetical protein
MITPTRTRMTAVLAAALCIAAAVTAGPAAADPPYGNGGHTVTRTDTNPGTSVRDAPTGLGSAGHGTPVLVRPGA